MTSRTRLAVAALVLLAALGFLATLAFAVNACPAEAPGQPCPGAASNRAVVVALVAISAGLTVTPFAFLGELAVRRIVYRGAWARAARRGALAGAVLATMGGLRLGDALSVPAALFVVALAAAVEWLSVRRLDAR
ncbi:MAG: hypothetical protein OEW24_01740 [Chloroflexota bacterium]|nr:hypothetical protein [Chloroflexota bacterium]